MIKQLMNMDENLGQILKFFRILSKIMNALNKFSSSKFKEFK